MKRATAIEVHNLTVSYSKKPVLWNVDFSIPEGALVGIIGPNGAGKSTLIKSIMGLIEPDAGYVELWDKKLELVRHRISYVPQRESVDWDFPASVMDVVLMGRYGKHKLFKRLTKEDRIIANESLEKVGMESFQNRQISQLSGGQQQRVFLARALTQEADLYLMDEPFAGIDAATEDSIMSLMKEMQRLKKTLMVVHHDLDSVKSLFDHVILLNKHLVAAGPTETIFVTKNLQDAYGGKLQLLTKVGELLQKEEVPVRKSID